MKIDTSTARNKVHACWKSAGKLINVPACLFRTLEYVGQVPGPTQDLALGQPQRPCHVRLTGWCGHNQGTSHPPDGNSDLD